MDEFKKLTCSRRGHKAHLSKILSNVDEILHRLSDTERDTSNPTLSSFDAVILAEYLKQLKLKTVVFTELDEKIMAKIEDEEKLESTVFESADLRAMLSEKIAVITHTLEVDSPCERVVYQSAAANTQKDNGNEPQPMTHSIDTGNNRDTPLQDRMGMNLPSQQEFQTVHVSGDLTETSISQPAANPTQHGSGSDPPSSNVHGNRECSEVSSADTLLPDYQNLKFPFSQECHWDGSLSGTVLKLLSMPTPVSLTFRS